MISTKIPFGSLFIAILKIGGVISVAIVCALGCVRAYAPLYNRTAEKMLHATLPLIDEYQRKHRALPSSLDDLASRPKLRLLRIFPSPELYYWPKDGNYRIGFYQWPCGPHNVYDAKTHEWTYEE